MTKEQKALKEKKAKRRQTFNRGLAIVMVLFTLLPMGFSVYQSISMTVSSEQVTVPVEEQSTELDN